MHIVSDKLLERPGWKYNSDGVGYPEGMEPLIRWHHIDGPVLYTSTGKLYWLTFWERVQCATGFADVLTLDEKHR